MDIFIGLTIIFGGYLWLLFMDRFFKSCAHYGYIQFLNGTGFEIRFLQILWSSTALNNSFGRFGITSWLNKLWFSVGLCASLVLLPISIYLLLVAFLQNFSHNSDTEYVLQPVVPGITLPASELGYYSISLLISSILHELGHAVAASADDVNINSVGLHIIFILPIAYVNVNSDKLFSLHPWQRLKILCAGVWHNLLLALFAYLLYSTLPYFFTPLFDHGSGVIVTKLTPKSPLLGERGLAPGNKLLQINECQVNNESSWFKCLSHFQGNKAPAFCIEADVVHNLDESVHLKNLENGAVSCCHKDNKGKLCFEYLDSIDDILDFPPYVCLPGRSVIEVAKNFCTEQNVCPKGTFCFRPVLVNSTNLFRIKRKGLSDVIYIGLVSDFVSIQVSSYIPKYEFLSTQIPDSATKLLGYLAVFSMGLAIVNILPCMYMDGQHVINTLFHLVLAKHLRTSHIKVISAVVTITFTVLLSIHCIFVIWHNLNY